MTLGDLTSEAAANQVADAVEANWGGVDILVNNSGRKTGEGQTPWWELKIDDWLQTYQMCVLSAVRLIKRLVPGMNRDFHFGLPGTIQPESSRSKEIISSPTIRQGSHGRSCDSPTPPILPCAGHWEQTQ